MKRSMFAAGALAILLGVTACSGGAASGGGDDSAGSGGVDQAGLERAQAIVEEYLAIPQFVAPGEPLDGKAIGEGKKILVVPSMGTLQAKR